MRKNLALMMLPLGIASFALSACGDPGGDGDGDGDATSITTTIGDGDGDGDGDGEGDGDGDGDTNMCPDDGCLDVLGDGDGDGPSGCATDGSCDKIDLLFVIDNSGTMGEEQLNLAANFPLLIDQLKMLEDSEGNLIDPDVQIMVTTTDMGHPACTPFQQDGYEPKQGAPVNDACINRLGDFTGLGSNPLVIEEACTTGCPVAKAPIDPFMAFGPDGTNVPGDDVKGAMSCIAPQGINGCGYEAPLESMLQALNPGAEWNQGDRPFLRDDAILAIAVVTDEADCSVRSPDGYAFFTNPMFDTYWEVNPETRAPRPRRPRRCAGTPASTAARPDGNGIYADCMSADNGVLHPLEPLQQLPARAPSCREREQRGHHARDPRRPRGHGPQPQPALPADRPAASTRSSTASGVDGAYPGGDILPGDDGDDAAQKEFGVRDRTGLHGRGRHGRVQRARRSRRSASRRSAKSSTSTTMLRSIRCCIESICDSDFSDALRCLSGIIQTTIVPPG